MKLRSFSSVVADICSVHLDDDAGKLRGKVARALRNALAELGAHLPTTIKSAFFTVSDSLTVQLPSDLSDVTKVATNCGGALNQMSRDNNIRRALPATACSCDEGDTCTACTFFNFATYADGGAYGLKANSLARAEFRHNKDENRLEFNSIVSAGDEVLIEYKTVGSDESLALIPAEWVNMLGSYVGLQVNTQNRPGVAAAHKQNFLSSWHAFKAAANPYTAQELITALMGESMSAPKN